MNDHETVEPLIPWYATGSLSPEERARIERHLPGCSACRDLLEHARLHKDVLARRGTGFLAHVDPVLLTEFAEHPEALDIETRRWIERTLAECATCREAYALLGDVAVSLAPARTPVRSTVGLWDWLGATLLRPAPALAYLLLLAVLVPYLLVREGGSEAPLSIAPVLVVPAEPAVRDEAVQEPTPPLVVPSAQGGSETVVLLLQTALVAADLRDGKLPLRVELRRDGALLWSKPIGPDELELQSGRGVLPLVLRAGTLHPGAEYEVAIRAVLPGDPLDGQALFRRRLATEERK